jgi:hypothetical protein
MKRFREDNNNNNDNNSTNDQEKPTKKLAPDSGTDSGLNPPPLENESQIAVPTQENNQTRTTQPISNVQPPFQYYYYFFFCF